MVGSSHISAAIDNDGSPAVFSDGNPAFDPKYSQSFGLEQYQQITDSLTGSMDNRAIHDRWTGYLMENLGITLNELSNVRNTNATVAGYYESLLDDFNKLNGQLKVARLQKADLYIRNEELQADLLVANQMLDEKQAEILAANQKADQKQTDLLVANRKVDQTQTDLLAANKTIFQASREREFHLDRISILEQSVEKFRALVVNNRVGSYQLLDWWVKNSLLKPMDELYFEHSTKGDDDGDEFHSPSKQGSNIVEEFWGTYDSETSVACAVDIGSLEKKNLSDSSSDKSPAYTSPAHSAKADSSNLGDKASTVRGTVSSSDAGTCTSMYTANIRQILITNKNKAMMNAALENKTLINEELVAKDMVVGGSADLPYAENVGEMVSTALIDTHKENLLTNDSPPTNLPQDYRIAKSAPEYRLRKRAVETSQDNTRYCDIARMPGYQPPPWGDGPGPQVVYADPDEVAGDWNDVPVPLELVRGREKPKKPRKERPVILPRTSKREVVLCYLPHYITTGMLSSFVRGGKVEEFFIEDSGYYGPKIHPMSCAIRFYSESDAANFFQWVMADPPLFIDDYRTRCGMRMIHEPPPLPERGETRSVLFVTLPEGVSDTYSLKVFVLGIAQQHKIIIGIEDVMVYENPGKRVVSMEDGSAGVEASIPSDTEREQTIKPDDSSKGEGSMSNVENDGTTTLDHGDKAPNDTGKVDVKTPRTRIKRIYPGYVAFQKMKQSLPMFEVFKKLGLDIKWARDRCDGPLFVKKPRYDFVPNENKDDEDYDPEYPHIVAQKLQAIELARIEAERALVSVENDRLAVRKLMGLA